jgi:hypothetical protein
VAKSPQVGIAAMRALVAFLALSFSAAFAADADVVPAQKRLAEDNCRAVQLAPLATAETAHFLVYGDTSAPRLKGLATSLEKQYATAAAALQFDKKERPWVGKLAVYVLADRGQYRSFVRQVEKRSPDDGETSSRVVTGESPHVAVAPPQGKDAITTETQAGYDVAMALLSVRGKNSPVPEWVTQGFARATSAHAANSPASVRKRAARHLAGRLKPAEVWNDSLSIDDRMPLATGVADYLFYGKGLSRPVDFLQAFRGDDEKPMKTVADALEAVKLTPERFESGYIAWLRSNN